MKTYYKLVYKYLYEYRSCGVYLQPYSISYPPNSIIKAPESGPIFIFDSKEHLDDYANDYYERTNLYYYKVHALGVRKPLSVCDYAIITYKEYSPDRFWRQMKEVNTDLIISNNNMYVMHAPTGTLVARVIKTLGEAIKL